tara:strand:- start:760 stop:1191 length:432 start_codon:yes stop_codon:yes gene_type:complete
MINKSQLKSLLRFDIIRILKLLEIAQYTILAALSAIILGPLINLILPAQNATDSSLKIILYIIVELGVIGVFTYYIRKLVLLIPFLFSSLNKKYIANRRGSALLAIGVGLGIVFNRTQINLLERIDNLIKMFHIKYLTLAKSI